MWFDIIDSCKIEMTYELYKIFREDIIPGHACRFHVHGLKNLH